METSTPKKKSSRTYGGLSNEERKAERRERFLEAGLEVFGTVGIRGAKVRGLCKAAGLTERYFYESFSSTDELYCAVYEQQIKALQVSTMEQLQNLPRGDLEARTRASLYNYFEFMRDGRVVRVLYLEGMVGSEDVIAMHQKQVHWQAEMSSLMIKMDNPAIQLDDEIILSTALAINSATTNMAAQWMLGDYEMSIDSVVESCSMLVLGTMKELEALSERKKKPA